MHARGCDFSSGEETLDCGSSIEVRAHAAHAIVRRGRHGAMFVRGIDGWVPIPLPERGRLDIVRGRVVLIAQQL